MIRSLAILAIAMSTCCAAEVHQTNDQIHLQAMVQDVVMLSSFTGTVTPVDIDPHFALTLRIESVTPATANFAAGSVHTFAVHSPARLFAGEDAKGMTYNFSVRCKTEKGKARYFELEIRKKQANRVTGANAGGA